MSYDFRYRVATRPRLNWKKVDDRRHEVNTSGGFMYSGRVELPKKSSTKWKALYQAAAGWTAINGKDEFDSPEEAMVAVEDYVRDERKGISSLEVSAVHFHLSPGLF